LTIPIPVAPSPGSRDEEADSPEAIEAWIQWYDSLEPLEFTSEECTAWEAARREQKDFEVAQ
jgi:hypothetical protein